MKSIFLVLFISQIASAQEDSNKSWCAKAEKVLFACKHKEKLISLCASNDLNSKDGYLQYRAGKNSKIELEFPKTKKHPSELFFFSLMPRGGLLSFKNEEFSYALSSDLSDKSYIDIKKGDKKISSFECVDTIDNVNLTMTPIQKLLRDAGLEKN